MNVEAWLSRAARVAGDASAVEADGRVWSYEELLAAAWAGWRDLAANGVRPGDLVAIDLPAGLAFVQALHACWLGGAAALPLDPRMSALEREKLCEGATLRVTAPLSPASRADSLPASAGRSLRPARHELDEVALVLHTSGTTAAPKRVQLSYRNLLFSALGSAVALGGGPDERWLCTLPLCHVGGLSILARSAIFASTAVVHERFETDRALAALTGEGITAVSVVATTLARLLDAGLAHPPSLRVALAGGGPVPPALLARAQASGVTVSQTYGLTESSSQACSVPLSMTRGAQRPERLGAGRPLFCVKMRLAADGEILLAGPTIARSAAQPDGFLATGDIGRLDSEGNLHVIGRRAETIISGGENVAPAEVEAVLEAHPDVQEAAVVARSHPEWGEAVTAIVVPRAGSSPDADLLRAHCAQSLAGYKVPKQVEIRQAPLPRTRSGKLLRRELV